MDNPFLKRATEHLRDEEAFLGIVTPEPVRHYLKGPAQSDVLYDRLVMVQGTPGSGKTTIARLFELPMIAALLRNSESAMYKPLHAALADCRAVVAGKPAVIACRLSMESDYREIWEFPYPQELRVALTLALVQARAVIAWSRHLERVGSKPADFQIIPVSSAEAAMAAVGGESGPASVARAKSVERDLYEAVAALIPPSIDKLGPACTSAYKPFDVIEALRLGQSGPWPGTTLIPLVILDDAHSLHPTQFKELRSSLARRELKVARWVLTRFDVMPPAEALEAAMEDRSPPPPLPGVNARREITTITLQSAGAGEQRRQHRLQFRTMAKDMANRYLRLMPLFSSRKLDRFEDLLNTGDQPWLSTTDLEKLRNSVEATQSKLRITTSRRSSIAAEVNRYAKEAPEEIRLAMVEVLMHRYANRIPQAGLFGSADPEPRKRLKADAAILGAATIRLFHEFRRPYYFGMDDLCDAATENAEQFLHLAARMVDESAANVVRARRPSLEQEVQHRLLRARAGEIFREWAFPYVDSVRQLVTKLAERLLARTLEPNAPLDSGASAYGISQEEFETIPAREPHLAGVLKYGLAYCALTLLPNYSCKNENWCLVELGGIPLLHFGLTLRRGGFVEGNLQELSRLAAERDR